MIIAREGKDIGLQTILVPEVLLTSPLIRWLTFFGPFFLNFDWLVQQIQCRIFSNQYYNSKEG